MNLTLNPYDISHKSKPSLNRINPSFLTPNIKLNNMPLDTFEKSQISFTSLNKKNELLDGIFSPLEIARLQYQPKLTPAMRQGIAKLEVVEGDSTESISDQDEIKTLFPNTYGQPALTFKTTDERKPAKTMKVGIILSGGQASGGHNVITGIYDALKQANPKNEIYGFLGGPSGLVEGKCIKLTDETIDKHRNMGGFSMFGSGRTKLEKEAQFEKALANCKRLGISAVTIIGGDDSNTNAAVLAEWFKNKGEDIQIIGCPKTIDGDLKNENIETSFGFDTATKTYSETVGNIQKDAASAKKHWHFVKLMGRNASHVTLEVAMQTHPNITLISEEVAEKQMSLEDVVDSVASSIAKRSEAGKNYGVAVIPEGLIEFIPEMKSMISNLNDVLPELESNSRFSDVELSKEKFALVEEELEEENAKVYHSLPDLIKEQLLNERDPHGNVIVSAIDTDKLLIEMVKMKLDQMKKDGDYSGKFSTQSHFCGYEGRAGLPSNFDSDYCYSLGYSAAALINSGKTGYIATVKNLSEKTDKWIAGGTPLTMMMNMEKRNGEMKPVIKKALVDTNGPVFKELKKHREEWALSDNYLCPGPIQFYGPNKIADKITETLKLEKG